MYACLHENALSNPLWCNRFTWFKSQRRRFLTLEHSKEGTVLLRNLLQSFNNPTSWTSVKTGTLDIECTASSTLARAVSTWLGVALSA